TAFAATGRAGLALTADEIMDKAVKRSDEVRKLHVTNAVSYTKVTSQEDIDSSGELKERKDKTYKVEVREGLSYLTLVQLNGQQLTSAEQKRENQKETERRNKMRGSENKKGGDDRENFLTAELVSKYDFTLLGTTNILGRKSYCLTFEPKKGLKISQIADRLVNNIYGEVWIDDGDFEIARAVLHLKSEVTLWGGMLASLKKFSFEIQRTPFNGLWLNTYSQGEFEGRKLLDTVRMKTRSESRDFKPLGA
ncbi:MAG: hypothetical protein JWN25_3015, partial [Verrucomicrobiales bacterium]|nr:hypothetical protein [Verrucomicrobiales bacterium]